MGKKQKSVRFELVILISVLLLGLTTAAINLAGNSQPTEIAVLGIADKANAQIAYWEELLADNPNYIQGWLELARLLHNYGDVDYALGAFNTAKAINPNHEAVINFEY